MTCLEFTKRLGEIDGWQQSLLKSDSALREHAASCSQCGKRIENERSLTLGLELLAEVDRKVEAPLSLRSDLLVAFENQFGTAPENVVHFPSRPKWTRWALAAAASLVFGVVLLFARWAPISEVSETARGVVPAVTYRPADLRINRGVKEPSISASDATVAALRNNRVPRPVHTTHDVYQVGIDDTSTQVASAEVKSEFVPLTYLNNATAMDSGIVVRVEIEREQLATLGLPFDLERADDIIKADIVLGDDGVARAIRLVQ